MVGAIFRARPRIPSPRMPNGRSNGRAVLEFVYWAPDDIDVQFSRYPLPRGIDIYSRLLLHHSSTPVTQRATPTIARWWDAILGENVDAGIPKSDSGFGRDSLAFSADFLISTRCRCQFHLFLGVGCGRCYFSRTPTDPKPAHAKRQVEWTSGSRVCLLGAR